MSTINGDGNNNTLDGGSEPDTINAGAGNDTVSGNAGNDTIYGGSGADTVDGGDGVDSLYGGSGNDSLSGGAGSDQMLAGTGDDLLFGGTENDSLMGQSGNDALYGGDGDDFAFGGVGNDLIEGGAGNDSLRGDTLTITDFAPFAPTSGSVVNGSITNASTMAIDIYRVDSAGNPVFVGTLPAGKSLSGPVNTGETYFATEPGTMNVLDLGSAAEINHYTFNAAFNDTISGGDGDDTIHGEFGEDVLFGGTGADSLFGGVGNDTVFGGLGDDHVELGDGNDSFGNFDDEGGNDTVFGGAGNDHIIGGGENDLLFGGVGNDTLSGGVGSDSSHGGAGDDVFLVTDDHEADFIDGGDGFDYIAFSNFQTQQGIRVIFTGSDQGTYSFAGTNTSGSFLQTEGMWGTEFADTIDASADTNGGAYHTHDGDDVVFGGSGADTIGAGSGNDLIHGGAGDDAIWSGGGNDTVYGGDGNDVIDDHDSDVAGDSLLFGGAGDDTIWGGLGRDTIYGGSGNDAIRGGFDADLIVVSSGEGVDTIIGGEASDDTDALMLSGGDPVNVVMTGSEAGTYSFGGGGSGGFSEIEVIETGSGNDTIDASASGGGMQIRAAEGSDVILGGVGSDTIFGGAGDDSITNGSGGADVLSGGDGDDTFTIAGSGTTVITGGEGRETHGDKLILVSSDGTTVIYTGPEAGTFDDGTSAGRFSEIERLTLGGGNDRVDAQATTAGSAFDLGAGHDSLIGGSGKDTIAGDAGDDTIRGGAGDDLIFGGDGRDQIYADGGSDRIFGGADADTVFVGNATGDSTVEGGETGDDTDVLSFADARGPAGFDVVVRVNEGGTATRGDSLVRFTQIETFEGSANADRFDAAGTTTGQTIYGGGGADTIIGGAGGDALAGGDGDDILTGGQGDDRILGGEGSDTAVFAGDVTDYSFDRTPNGALIVTDSVAGRDGTDTLTGIDFVTFNGVTYTLVTGDDGSNTTLQAPDDGTPSLIIAHDGNDWGGGHATSDAIFGGVGDDTLDGGDGDDTLVGEADDDLLRGDAGDDALFGGAGNDRLEGGEGSDTLNGDDGDDSLRGDNGEDELSGDGGNDTLDGGADADVLTGGAGSDLFVLTEDGGRDVVTDFDMTRVDGRTVDQLDVSDLTTLTGAPLTWRDVKVRGSASDGVGGDAVLTFPNGETVVLTGVAPEDVSSKQSMAQIGIPCFATGTPILTPEGWRKVEDLGTGDLVLTQAQGVMPVLWAGGRQLDAAMLRDRPALYPVRIARGVLGNHRDLLVSPQHAVLMQLDRQDAVLVRAVHLARHGHGGFRVARGIAKLGYHHLLLPQHAVVNAAGAALESLYPGRLALSALGPVAQIEVAATLIARLGKGDLPPMSLGGLAALYGPRVAPVLLERQVVVALAEGRLRPLSVWCDLDDAVA